jgi:predicted MFS family arabinose efflux permease
LPHIGFPGLILGTAILALPCGLVRSLFLRETGSPVASGEKLADFRFFQRRHGSFLMGAVFLALTLTLTVYGPFIALYANDVIGLVESRINLMFALGGLAAVSFSLLGGRIIDQIGGKKVLLFCLLVFPLMFVGWTQTRGFLPSTVGYVMGYLFFHTTNISYQIQLTSVAPSVHRGSLVGTFGSVSGVVSAAGPVLGSLLVSTVGQAGPFYGALVFALLAFYFFSRSPDAIGDG